MPSGTVHHLVKRQMMKTSNNNMMMTTAIGHAVKCLSSLSCPAGLAGTSI
jgi:hypothetical protein